MRAKALTLALLLLAPLPSFAGGLEDGLYVISEKGPGQRVKLNDGREMTLGPRAAVKLGPARLESLANDNSLFHLALDKVGPVAEKTFSLPRALALNGVLLPAQLRPVGDTGDFLTITAVVLGERNAHKVADRLGIKPLLRRHPGHRLEVRWTPMKEAFELGEAVTLKMEIRNLGAGPVTFPVGGKQRGARDNQFRFLAYRFFGGGPAVPDTGDPEHHGGKVSPRTLKQGEAFSKTVELTNWFTFREPDTYRVTGLFELSLQDGGADFTLWEDLAVGECLVRVVLKRE